MRKNVFFALALLIFIQPHGFTRGNRHAVVVSDVSKPASQAVKLASIVASDTLVLVAGGLDNEGLYSNRIQAWDGRNWTVAGRMRNPLAGGVAIGVPEGLIYIGGENEIGLQHNVDLYHLTSGEIPVIEALPSLPYGLTRMGGVKVGDHIYLAGGMTNDGASNSLLMLNLSDPEEGWKELAEFRGYPRVKPVFSAARVDEEISLFLWGGFFPGDSVLPPQIAADGFSYNRLTESWDSLPAPTDREGNVLVLGEATVTAWSDDELIVTGGYVHPVPPAPRKRLFRKRRSTANKAPDLQERFRSQSVDWFNYNRKLMKYDAVSGEWIELGELPALARINAASARMGAELLVFQGEVKPGVLAEDCVHVRIGLK